MGKFDLEANSDSIVPLFTGDVEDEATTEDQTKVMLDKAHQSAVQQNGQKPNQITKTLSCLDALIK